MNDPPRPSAPALVFLTAQEAADLLRVQRRSLYRLVQQQRIGYSGQSESKRGRGGLNRSQRFGLQILMYTQRRSCRAFEGFDLATICVKEL